MYISGVDIEFAEASYTFNEYDDTVEVCAATVNDTTYNTSISISVTTEETESASGKLVPCAVKTRRGGRKKEKDMSIHVTIFPILLCRRD